MTAQITDTVTYQGEIYSLIGKRPSPLRQTTNKTKQLATPESFGIEPVMIHTGCYRGYIARYHIRNGEIYLTELTVRDKHDTYPHISGVSPELGQLSATYRNLNVPITFSGKIRLAKDFIHDLYVHMGIQKATSFKTVLDLTLVSGKITNVADRSEEARQRRGESKRKYETGNPFQQILRAFSDDMDLM